MSLDASDRFVSELAVLRDSVVRAIRSDNTSNLKEGLDLYLSLVRTVLEEFHRFQSLSGTGGPGMFSFYGREMAWLEDDVRTFVSNAVQEPGSDALRETLGFALGLVRLALDQRELQAFGAFLAHFRWAWIEGRRRTKATSWPSLRANLLLTLEGLGNYWIGRTLSRNASARADAMPYAQRLLAELTQLMKISVDDSSTDDLQAATLTLRETLRHAADDLDDTEDLRLDSGSPSTSVPALKGAAILAVESWIRFRHKYDRTSDADGRALLGSLRSVAVPVDWKSFEAALDHATADLFNWRWWESGLWENRRGGTLTFDAYLSETFARRLLAGDARIPASVDEAHPGFKYRVKELQEQVNDLGEAPDPLAGHLDQAERITDLDAQLTNLIARLQLDDDRALVDLPLVPGHVVRFRAAVFESWGGSRHLRPLGTSAVWDSASAGSAPGGFGINRLVPKEFFVDHPGVFADPGDLGREFGDAVGRGEDEQILNTLRGLLPVKSIAIDDLAGNVQSTVNQLLDKGLQPTILVLNSWELLEALRSIIEPENQWATADPEGATRLQGSDTPVLLRYGAAGDLCIVADFERAFTVVFKDPDVERPGDSVDWPLLTGVDTIDQTVARALVDDSPALRRHNGVELGRDAALLNVQKMVHVRVLEWIRIEPGSSDAGVIFDMS